MSAFTAEALIIARITSVVTGLEFVGSISQLRQFETIPPVPSVIVRPLGSVVENAPNDGNYQIELQSWEVVLSVDHDQTDTTETSTNVIAEPYITLIQQALVGWRPAQGFHPMAYTGMTEPYYEPGYGEYPLTFETGQIITGNG